MRARRRIVLVVSGAMLALGAAVPAVAPAQAVTTGDAGCSSFPTNARTYTVRGLPPQDPSTASLTIVGGMGRAPGGAITTTYATRIRANGRATVSVLATPGCWAWFTMTGRLSASSTFLTSRTVLLKP